jgi:DNA polymerase lambda
LAISKLSPTSQARRLDILYAPPNEYSFAILYFTGSQSFNISMRLYAMKLGLKLNEHGIYKHNEGRQDSKINEIFTNEAEIFSYLGLQFVAPSDRNDSLSLEANKCVQSPSKKNKLN